MATGRLFQQMRLPEQKTCSDGGLFPAVLSPNTDNTSVFEEAIKDEKPWLESLLNERGAILFRGFSVTSPSDFNDVVEAFGFPEAIYIGGRGSRTKVLGRIYTSNESPPDKKIPFHHEMAYLPDYPSKLFFFCEEEPEQGGETPIVLSHLVYDKMKEKYPEFVAKLEEHGATYLKIMSDEDRPSSVTGKSWKSTYMTEDKNVAEERAAKLGTKLEWMQNAVKVITGPLPAIKFDKESQRNTWFNNLVISNISPMKGNIHDHDTFVEVGNGELVPDHVIKDCVRILEEECVAIPWKKGDVMLVNNLTVLHGRQPLLKPPRRILASQDGIVFPVVLSPHNTNVTEEENVCLLVEAIKAEKPWLESLLNKNGAILFRGFPVTTPSDFNDMVEAFGFPELSYLGGRAPRTQVVGRVYTANESPPEKRIHFHHEMCEGSKAGKQVRMDRE